MLSQKLFNTADFLGKHIDDNRPLTATQMRAMYVNLVTYAESAALLEAAMMSEDAMEKDERALIDSGKVVYISTRRACKTDGRPPGGGAA